MLNRYSALPKATIQNNQVLPELGILDKALERKQQTYNAQADAIELTKSDVSGLEFYGNAANQYKSAIDSVLNNAIDKWSGMDLASPEARNEVNKTLSAINNDPQLKMHHTAAQAYKGMQEQIAKMDAEGNFNMANAYPYMKAFQEYSKTGKFNDALKNPAIMKNVDINEEGKKYFNQLQADGGDIHQSLASTVGSIHYNDGWKGISGKKISDQTERSLNTWINSNAGKQLMNEYYMKTDQKIDTGASSAQEYAAKALGNIGKGFQYSQTSSGFAAAANEKRKEEKDEKTMPGVSGEYDNGYGKKGREFNTDGTIKGSGQGILEHLKVFGLSGLLTAYNDNSLSPEEKQDASNVALMAYAKANNVTPQQASKALQLDAKETVATKDYVSAAKSDAMTKNLFDKGAGLWGSVMTRDKDGTMVNGAAGLRTKLGLDSDASVEDVIKAVEAKGIRVSGEIEPNSMAAGGYKLNVGGDDFMVDTTPVIESRVMKGIATKEEQKAYQEYEVEKMRKGQFVPVPRPEGTSENYFKYLDMNSGKIKAISESKMNELIDN